MSGNIIQLLPDSIANQIAAGEVVQRPASVVKELLENSVDAGATQITVLVKEAGKALIQVADNGNGMGETDARMSLERHATSKIHAADDLFHLKTMGFRGEALASIAAVAQVEMLTKQPQDELGTRIICEGSEIKTHEPAQTKDGTTLSVKNLFFNIPARRNFLKSNGVEMRHIIDEFQRIAISCPDIAFRLYHNNQELYNLPKSRLSKRIVNIFGKNYQEQLVYCEEKTAWIEINGYVGKPEFAKKTRGEQFFYVNNRYIKSNYLNHAVTQAYEGMLPQDSHPFYVLFISINPENIDINVHPTKTEIKFTDERTVYAIIRAAVKKSLGTHNVTPSLDFEQDVNFSSFNPPQFNNAQSVPAQDKSYTQFKSSLHQRNLKNWEKLYEEANVEKPFNTDFPEASQDNQEEETVLTFSSAANKMEGEENPSEPEFTKEKVFLLHNSYIAVQVKSGLMLIHHQSALERIYYEKYSNQLENKKPTTQQLLFPQELQINHGDMDMVKEIAGEIQNIGFAFEIREPNKVIINGTPPNLPSGQESALFEGLIEQFKWNKDQLRLTVTDNMARSLARRMASASHKNLSEEEMQQIINELFTCQNPNYTPDGRQIFTILRLEMIQDLFNK